MVHTTSNITTPSCWSTTCAFTEDAHGATLHRPVTDSLGCTIVLAGMAAPQDSEFVAAVTEGVGFGLLGIVRELVELIRADVSALRFGVNLVAAATDLDVLRRTSPSVDLGARRSSVSSGARPSSWMHARAAEIIVAYQSGLACRGGGASRRADHRSPGG